MNSKLHDAVAIFKSLGWEDVTPETVLQLPLGTTQQKQVALAGLKSGEWGEIAEIRENTFGYKSYINVDEHKLALFAVRLGVDARRAAAILHGTDNEMCIEVIAERGSNYASDFISYACTSRRRGYEHSASMFGTIAVRLVDKLNLDIPQNVEYMKDWSVYAAIAMGFYAEVHFNDTNLPYLNLIERRFTDHIVTGVAVNTPATGPFGLVLPAGIKRGWFARDKGAELIFLALDMSVRPGDRKIWIDVLDELDISDQELCARTQALIPLLASGDSAVVMRLAPTLIAKADEVVVTEVLIAALSVKTKKAKRLVLNAALGRSRPKNVEELIPWLLTLATDTDKTIADLSAKLLKKWGIEDEVQSKDESKIQCLWQETPPIWEVPLFNLGEISPDQLTELAAELVSRSVFVHDVTTERFLAMANAVAYQNPETARISLQGVRSRRQLLDDVVCWVKEEQPCYGYDKGEAGIQPPLTARDYIVCLHLGKQPCLLSTPSKVDLSIHVSDLVERLLLYEQTKTNVLEADLFLALTRLDVHTKTAESIDRLNQITVPVLLQSGAEMAVTAGQAILHYLDNPIIEPSIRIYDDKYWEAEKISATNSLPHFPVRLRGHHYELFSIFPLWGDAALDAVRWDSEVYHEQGLILRQIARRTVPLPPGASINLLAAQRSMPSDAAEDSMCAVAEAWERGLLRPGIADVALLDWRTSPPANLAALSSVLDDIAQDGMLSVAWPVLEALIATSLQQPRLLSGTAELAGLMERYLPEVLFAIEKGIADDTSLHLSGIRSLAQHGGTSLAVRSAQKITSQLPAMQIETNRNEELVSVLDPSFDKVWEKHREASSPIDDGAMITVDWANPESPTRFFLFTLTLPNYSDRIFQVVNRGWYYDLECEGQCSAYVAAPNTTTFSGDEKNRVWLHWDEELKAMVVCDMRNWIDKKDTPLECTPTPLSSSLLTVLIGLLAQDGDAIYYAPRLLEQFIEDGQIGEEMVRRATRILIQSPVVSPAKLVRVLEKDLNLLPVLWPMLTECMKYASELAAECKSLPVWLNRILDIALRYAPYLLEAANRGLIPAEDAKWMGLSEIASLKSKSVAVGKAKKLIVALG